MHFLVCICLLVSFVNGYGPRKLYTLEMPSEIASATIIGRDLFVVGPYYIAKVKNIHWNYASKARMEFKVINRDIPYPRFIEGINYGTIGKVSGQLYWVASWSHNDTSGRIDIMKETEDYSTWKNIDIGHEWNYERAHFVDMNMDGRKDCLTARYKEDSSGGITGQLVWFEQPKGQGQWLQKILHAGGSDANFIPFARKRKRYILSAGNHFNSLTLLWSEDPKKSWNDDKQLRHRVIDNYGRYYDLQYVDLNMDKRLDILTSTLVVDGSEGRVLGYNLPNDIEYGDWERKVLYKGFKSEYSPGKAIAYWPNKANQKKNRPCIFLTGGTEGKINILFPRPKTSGWSYVKASVDVSPNVVVGIPAMMDLNSDKSPEFFIPQGKELHVYSYDYKSSVAEPPGSADEMEADPKPPVNFRPVFYRPTPAPNPLIPENASPVAEVIPTDPNDFTTSKRSQSNPTPPVLPKRNQDRRPIRTNQSPSPSTTFRNIAKTISQYREVYEPSTPARTRASINLKFAQSDDIEPKSTPSPRTNQIQPAVPPMYPYPIPYNGTGIAPGVLPYYPPQWMYPWYPFPPGQVQPPVTTTTAKTSTVAPQPANVDFSKMNASEVVKYLATAKTPSTTTISTTTEVAFEVPSNLVLSLSSEQFWSWDEAFDACKMDRRSLCTLRELQEAVQSGGVIPDNYWGWYATQGRAAKPEKCTPGEVKFDGYVCYNGDVAHTPIRQDAYLHAMCCAVVNGAVHTVQKFKVHSEAEQYCGEIGHHLCTMDEMINVWMQSTYKSLSWGWHQDPKSLLRMTYRCRLDTVLWQGYECISGILETSQVYTSTYERAYCCENADNAASTTNQSTLLISSIVVLSVALLLNFS